MRSDNPFGTCRSCGKRILWVRTKAGKNMPCNPELVTYVSRYGAKDKIVTPNGEVLSGEVVSAGTLNSTGIGYISHFATCPNADRYRKK